MDETINMLLAIAVLFVIFIAPLWLLLHYITRWKSAKSGGLADEDLARLKELETSTSHLRDRIRVLERILDEKTPDWRRS